MTLNTPTDASHTKENDLKRRKVRKGTTSCWECKRRKKRCEFGLESTSICHHCQRFGLTCISQEFADPDANQNGQLGQRIDQVEALVHRLVEERKGHLELIPSTVLQQRNPGNLPTLRSVNHERLSRGRSLTGFLFSIFPDQATASIILSSKKLFASPLQLAQKLKDDPMSITIMDQGYFQPASNEHPIMFAQMLIKLAICLKQFGPSSSKQLTRRMNEPLDKVAKRYVDSASHFVISQDYLVGSLDGLETMILQSCYYATSGDYRSAWEIQRRAAAIAQTIGLPNLAEESGGRAERLWFQITYSDRFLSLILGVPFSVANNSFASAARLSASSPMERLERIHTLVAGRIIVRNVRMQRITGLQEPETQFYGHYKETKSIDSQLKKATRILPTNWWLVPSLDDVCDHQTPETAPRVLAQMHQYYLLVLSHQPYLIYNQFTALVQADYNYSKVAAASASREVLIRYLRIRNCRRSPSYRGLDEKAFLCCVVLIFAHFLCHGNDDADFLDHMRAYDLATIEMVLNLWREISTTLEDPQCDFHTSKVRRFMEIEEDAANGGYYSTCTEGETSSGSIKDITDSPLEFRLSFPYFGVVSISSRAPQRPDAEYQSSAGEGLLEKYPEEQTLNFDDSQFQPSTWPTTWELGSPGVDMTWLDNWIHVEPDDDRGHS
ncbi:hypothetical protein N7478_000862 [Penicillium angulare]|uniref:uncharacterized protein n=1 Tax=Penicillium angulare TaxID=116970 RepID=UPI002540EF03|nr:uncharacterized protein N7478_000862 [Penicillium angulare]KAJ5291611.1 hypothetical protein N7478_000862 [Penicillium angulare]